jgi:sugar phosphate isomerase/epimerase
MIRRAADAAEREGVVLAVENHLDLFADELVELLETIASPYVAVCFDTANNVRLLEDPLVVARKLAPYARATHIKDVVAFRGDPKVFTSWPSVPAGKGIVNLTEILEILRATGYRGLLALEIDYLHPDYGDEEEALESGMTFLKCWAGGPSSVPST